MNEIIYISEYNNVISNNCISQFNILLDCFQQNVYRMDINEAVLHDIASQICARIINLIAISSPHLIVIQTYVWTQWKIITGSINSLSGRIIDFIFRRVVWDTEFRDFRYDPL